MNMGGQCVGLLTSEAGNLYLAEMMTAFVDAAQSRRFRSLILLGRTWRSPVDNESLHNVVFRCAPYLGLRGQVVASALLSTYQPLNDLPDEAGLSDANTVYMGGALRPGQMSVELDAASAIRSAIRHLVLEHGCRRVACVTGLAQNPETVLRLRAYRQAVRELQLPWSPEWEECGGFTAEGGQQAIQALMERLPGIEGVFFMSDAMALGAMHYFESGRVPGFRRPRFVAFDDIEELHYLDIPLTTIAQPLDQIMEECVKRLAGDGVPPHADVPASLVIRRSCGCEMTLERPKSRSAFREGLDLLFSLQKVRLAVQGLNSEFSALSWDTRLGGALSRMGLPWVALLEWKGDHPPINLGTAVFHRYTEYGKGKLLEGCERFDVGISVLAETLGRQLEPMVLVPLVSAHRFLGFMLLRHEPGLEQTYDVFTDAVALSLAATRSGGL